MAARLLSVKCTDALWVGAREKPAQPGINKDAWVWRDGSSVPSSAWKRSPLILVSKGSIDQLVFANAAALALGRESTLALGSVAGSGIGQKWADPKQADIWFWNEAVQVPETQSARVQYIDNTFLKLSDEDLVLDVAFGKLSEGTPVNFVGTADASKAETLCSLSDCPGRHWTINDDGSIAPSASPDLALGMKQTEPNNFQGAEEECGFAGWEISGIGLHDAECALALPFACEVAELAADEVVWVSEGGSRQKLPTCWPDLAAEKFDELGRMDGWSTGDAVLRVETSLPSTPGCLFEAGGTYQGTFVGLVPSSDDKGSLSFRFAAGDGSKAKDKSDAVTAVISMAASDDRLPQDGEVHEFILKISAANHSIELIVDGVQVAAGDVPVREVARGRVEPARTLPRGERQVEVGVWGRGEI